MPGVTPVYEHGPVTFEVSVNVTGGLLVEPDTANAGMVHLAGAASAICLGVATKDSVPASASQNSTVPIALTAYNESPVTQYVGVANNGVWNLTAAAAVAFGQLVKCAAAGTVTPYVQGTDTNPSLIIGRCVEPLGIASAGKGQIMLMLG